MVAPTTSEQSSAPASDLHTSDLKIEYGPNGLQRLSYGQCSLEDLDRFPADAFHIWHMKMSTLRGDSVSDGQYGWGENHKLRKWDAAGHAWTYEFTWGSIRVQFEQSGSTLNLTVTESNRADSGVILQGAEIFPFGVHFPAPPSTFHDSHSPQLADNTTAPSVVVADFGAGAVASVVSDSRKPLYSGFLPIGQEGTAFTPVISSTAPDGLATFQPHNDRPVRPGETDTFTVSLRFADKGVSPEIIGRDAYVNWAKAWPQELHWPDRRVIGTVYLASSPQGADRGNGFPNNPRRYFNAAGSSDFDVNTRAGLEAFQTRVLHQARTNVENLRKLDAQGVITWDIEGEEYPQSTSYVCAPDTIAETAPEMESIITEATSPYRGVKLDDAYFRIMTEAGFRVGVCVRPQHFTRSADGTARQVSLPETAVAAELIRKMKYAHDRWGATLFYVDSSVGRDGAILDASLFQQVARALPDALVIPEESTFKHYAYTAPFQSFLFHGETGTDPAVRASYPQAFSAILVNDVRSSTLAAKTPKLTNAVRAGDILMTHADYWQENNPAVVRLYRAAKTR